MTEAGPTQGSSSPPPGRLRVAELFAGVGGFRLGLHAAGHEVVWWNQWEPATKAQHAFDCYVANFHGNATVDPIHNTDIAKVPTSAIPDHDLLVAGFPCQDYSVASPLRHSKGLRGKKGVLWWEINRILEAKKPPYILLENVDRLLKSPKRRRGRDFSVLLACLARLRYVVEWRVTNAADYGQPQRRRRVFAFAARNGTAAAHFMRTAASNHDYLTRKGFFAGEFPVVQEAQAPTGHVPSSGRVGVDPRQASRQRKHPDYRNAGVMVSGRVWTSRVEALVETPQPRLRTLIQRDVPSEYFIPRGLLPRWKKAKREKDIPKTARGGYTYRYKEGSLPFPDELDQPARTLLTGEGSVRPSRSNHIIRQPWRMKGLRYRVLTPEECEALMGFPRGHTEMLPRRWRYFTMGNAVVVGIVKRVGDRLANFLAEVEPSGVASTGVAGVVEAPRVA